MIIAEIIFEQSAQMVVIEDDHMIQVATNASDHPLDVAVLPWALRCDENFLNPHSFNSRPEGFTVDSVAVSNHKPGSAVFRKCFDDLL